MQWWINAELATLTPDYDEYGLKSNHALGVLDEQISCIIPMTAWQAQAGDEIHDVQGRLITPGLIDCHTHLVYAGHRAMEFEQRLQGATYADIARQGGGILSTVKATRAVSEQELLEQSALRLEALIAEGVTTVEIKSGYGLDLDSELKMLRVARRLEQRYPIRVKTSLLAAHALPPEYKDHPEAFIDWVCLEAIPAAAAEKLADAVDVFCEEIGFNAGQCLRIFEAAQHHGLPVKGHMEQLSNLGGSAIAASFKALSVDHLEHLDIQGVKGIAESGTVATLLPGAFYFLREQRLPPIEQLREYRVPMALASDLNPGSSPLASLRLMLNMACTLFRLTPAEALAGVTRNGAQALGLSALTGQLQEGLQADFIQWNLEHPAQLSYQFGTQDVRQRVFAGTITSPYLSNYRRDA